ncbi:MAG: alpha/beta hydrolase [Candidatus Hinthialibacter antarcticus]|nr:alpha/beta hydrolase [Candidatus Hinthialibacter antarcticus]
MIIRQVFLLAVISLSLMNFASAQETIVLWPDGAPGAIGSEDADIPTLTVHLPAQEKNTGAAIVVCPGGGYGHLAMDHEGVQIAEWLNKNGIAAFILKYRIAPRYKHPAPISDAQRALRIVRSRAAEFKIKTDKIGILGFSAGGHLASTATTHFDSGKADADNAIEQASCRPDFSVLVYPVITMTDPYTHKGSRRNLLGENPSPEMIEFLSNEKQITAETPPVFIFQTNDDTSVPAENSVMFYLGLRKHNIPAEMHIYEPGRHGLGLAQSEPALSDWPDRCIEWFKTRKIIK